MNENTKITMNQNAKKNNESELKPKRWMRTQTTRMQTQIPNERMAFNGQLGPKALGHGPRTQRNRQRTATENTKITMNEKAKNNEKKEQGKRTQREQWMRTQNMMRTQIPNERTVFNGQLSSGHLALRQSPENKELKRTQRLECKNNDECERKKNKNEHGNLKWANGIQ